MTPGLVDVSISMQLTIPVQGDASCCSIVSVDLKTKVAFQYMLLIQGDTSCCAKPPVDFKTKIPFWPGLACPGQAKAGLLF